MGKLVFLNNNRLVADSLTIAETFGKRHSDVLRSIENMECSEEFTQRNFALSDYNDATGRKLPKYLITQDGFSFLVMGYTGKEAARFKEMYISEFNKMREEISNLIRPSYMIEDPIKRAERWITEQREVQRLDEENKAQSELLTLNAPKVSLYDVAMNAGNNKAVGTVAKMLGYGRNNLFKLLREKKVLRHNNEPYQTYIDRGYFDVRLYSMSHSNGEIENKQQTMVTPKGVDWIHNLLKEHQQAN